MGERFGQGAPFQVLPERNRVTPEGLPGDSDLFFAAPDQRRFAGRAAEEVERAPECAPGMLGIELGPEECEQGVAPQVAAWSRDGEVGEEGESLGLLHHGAELAASGDPQIDGTQRPQLEHHEE
jgi:hypothetical protein